MSRESLRPLFYFVFPAYSKSVQALFDTVRFVHDNGVNHDTTNAFAAYSIKFYSGNRNCYSPAAKMCQVNRL